MEDQSQFLVGALLEDKIIGLWPEYPSLYDVHFSDLKNQDMREIAYLEIGEKFEKSGKTHDTNIENLLKLYLFQYLLQY